MKKILLSIALVGGLAISSMAETVSVAVPPSGFTNLLTVSGIAKVTQVLVTASTATNTYVFAYDTPTSSQTYVTPAYIKTTRYMTNITTMDPAAYPGVVAFRTLYTNYFGVVTSNYTTALLDVTNTVAAATNTYPVRFGMGALAGMTAVETGVNYYFSSGIWVTNASLGNALVTITYQQ